MEGFKGEIVIKPSDTDRSNMLKIANCFHNQLVGNEDYINNNIGIYTGESTIVIWIDDCKNPIPELTF